MSCLFLHSKELSPPCAQELERYIQMRQQAAQRGGGAFSAFGGLNAMGSPLPLFSYDIRYSPGTFSPTITDDKANISSPVYHKGNQTVALSAAAGDLHIGNPILLNSGTQVPMDLYRYEFGAQLFNQLPEKRNWGLRASIGYAGDAPFQNANDDTYSLVANYGMPARGGANGYWMFFVFFSNNSPIGNFIPIPGADYIYRSETISAMIGLPILAIQWTPVNPWSFSAAFFGPTFQAEAGYGNIEKAQVYTGFYSTRQSFIPSQRTNSNWRLNVQESKVGIGVRTPIGSPAFLAELQTGKAFNRIIFIGSGYGNEDGGAALIPDDWYTSASIKAKF